MLILLFWRQRSIYSGEGNSNNIQKVKVRGFIYSRSCIVINDDLVMYQKGETEKNFCAKSRFHKCTNGMRGPGIIKGGSGEVNIIRKMRDGLDRCRKSKGDADRFGETVYR